ncbi:MAG: tetratricopeptide repeat protein [Polyangiales bacterium]
MQTALGEALRRHGISVAVSATAELERAVRVYAPDMVVLIGDAAIRGGESVVRRMAENRATDVLPVAVVSNDAVLKDEARDFRSGAVAVVPRGAGADSIARQLAELADEVPRRPGFVTGALDESNLQELLDLVSDETKTGILSIRSPKGVLDGMPVVIETERSSAHHTQQILDRLREAVASDVPLEYEFHETTGGRLSTLPSAVPPRNVDLKALYGSRVVVLDSNELRAEKLAAVLSSRGVQIAAADFSTAVIPRIREVDPQVVVLDSSAVGGQGVDFVRAMRKDPQLRWASMLVVRWEDFWPTSESDAEPDLPQLASRLLPMIDQDAEQARRAENEIDFDTRLELIGPGRLLRALGSVPGVRRVSISGSRRNIDVDIADNSIVGAYATLDEGTKQTLQGIPALLALWGLNAGRVSVREQDLPSVANIMMPVDEALGVISHQLGFADGDTGVEFNAATIPPDVPEAEEHATEPPESGTPHAFEESKTMAPVRFAHLQAAVGGAPAQAFPEEETPTNKLGRMLGRVETKQRTIPIAGGVQESHDHLGHTDHAHATPRKPKATEVGLAPVFEMLPQEVLEEQKTVPVPRKPTPPPPPVESRTPTGEPMLKPNSIFEAELARKLEGATMLAPGPEPRGMPASIQALLLTALLAGVGVLGWQLWMRGGSDAPESAEATSDAEGKKGPITGPLNGVRAVEEAEPESEEEVAMEFEEDEVEQDSPADVKVAKARAEPKAGTKAPEKAPRKAEPKPETKSPSAAAASPRVPTENLPRDPATASDVLVHRALPLIRSGQLSLAEATLDRAWELDPRNPQAMAGYATLFIAKKDPGRATKWAKKAVRKRPRRVEYHVLYGDALQLEDDTDAARKAWRKALAVDPNNRAAKARLAETGKRVAN